jgi:ketosteroid isomerase-like protein
MQENEQAIRNLVDTWMSASRTGDLATVLNLMDDEVVFLVPSREPFGKEEFAASSKEMQVIENCRRRERAEASNEDLEGSWDEQFKTKQSNGTRYRIGCRNTWGNWIWCRLIAGR